MLENGYKFVKWHVEGLDPRQMSLQDILTFQTHVANALFLPPEYVIICGIQPSTSIVIVFMMTEVYVNILQEQLEAKETFHTFQDIGVDIVDIGGTFYRLQGILCPCN